MLRVLPLSVSLALTVSSEFQTSFDRCHRDVCTRRVGGSEAV